MILGRMKVAALSVVALAGIAAAAVSTPPQAANAQTPSTGEGKLCRVLFEQSTSGGDTFTARGAIEITNTARQNDGSVYYMGRGEAVITYTAGGCRVAGSPHTTTLSAYVTSQDGRTAEVVIAPDEFSYPIVVTCGPQVSEMNAVIEAPDSVTLPLRDGASAAFSYEHHLIFAHGSGRGAVTLEFCRGGH
jgi:hypothetical protein